MKYTMSINAHGMKVLHMDDILSNSLKTFYGSLISVEFLPRYVQVNLNLTVYSNLYSYLECL